MTLHIKNMVCPRCVMVVNSLLNELALQPQKVQLGQATIVANTITDAEKNALSTRLEAVGFQLLDDRQSVLVAQIKALIIHQVHHAEEGMDHINWSQFLTQGLHRDYSSLSKLFSEMEGITIEQYIIRQKIERAKELLQNDELSLSQIAWQMGYSSTAHLSAQFKKTTGFTPSQFKKSPGRSPL